MGCSVGLQGQLLELDYVETQARCGRLIDYFVGF